MSFKALRSGREHLVGIPGVAGVGLSTYYRGELAVKGSEPVVVVYVEKYDPDIVRKIPSEIHGVKTVVVVSGKIRILSQRLMTGVEIHRAKYRPIMGGISCGSLDVGAGTLGCVVYDAVTGEPLCLSNNHVLAQAFEGAGFRVYKGKPIIQPGSADGGGYPDDVVGYLERWVPVKRTGENIVDCAVFKPTVEVEERVLGLVDRVPPVCNVEVGDVLRKSGRTTGVTESDVESIHSTVSVEAWGREYIFTDITISKEAMAEAGDSGSHTLDVTKKGTAGILFAGSEYKTCFIAGYNIERELGVKFSTAPVEITAPNLMAVGIIGLSIYLACRENISRGVRAAMP